MIRELDISITALQGGGFVICEGHGDDRCPRKAVTSLLEAAASVRDIIEERFQPDDEDEHTERMTMPRVVHQDGNVVRVPSFRGFLQSMVRRGA